MSETSVPAQVREIADALGLPFVLRANHTLRKYTVSPNVVTAVVDFITTTETAREVRYTRRGTRLMVWQATPDGKIGRSDIVAESGDWMQWEYSDIVVWDDTFKPYTEIKFGRIETPAEYYARRRWEGDQYRVGSNHSPMDSAQRVAEGYSPMSDYWNK